MAENISLNNVATFQNDTTAVNVVNGNNAAITTAFTDTLSRSGISPNQMTSTLDMNNNQIINLPFPTTLNSPARLQDVTNAQNITIINATTGTSGHTVPFLDGTNTWSAPQTLSVTTSGNVSAFTIFDTPSGNATSGVSLNLVSISDTVNAGAAFAQGFNVNHIFGGGTTQGGRQAVQGFAQLNSASNVASTISNYIGVVGASTAASADNGTGVTSGTAQGAFFGGNFLAFANAPATNLLNVSGAEFNAQMAAGSTCWAKSLAQFSSNPSDAVNGSGVNTMLWLYNQAGSTAKWSNALLIDN